MRKIKKFLCAALAATMVLAMAAPSFAAETTGTITIVRPGGEAGNADKSHTYNIYRLFTLESFEIINSESGEGKYAYKVESVWKDFLKEKGFTFASNGYLNGQPRIDNPEQFAKNALEHAELEMIDPVQTLTSGNDGKPVSTESLPLGYYLIDSTVGSLCVLDTTTSNVTITDKNVAPTIKKTVNSEDEGVQIGQNARYTITVTAQPNTDTYVIHDTMSAALELKEETVVVKLGDTELNNGIEYTINKSPEGSDGCSFEISFTGIDYTTITKATDIVVEYGAMVTANALGEGVDITNVAKLTYNAGEETPETPDVPTLNTYQFNLQKVAATTEEQLLGAEFELYDAFTEGNKILFVVVEDETVEEKVYRVATSDDTNTTATIEAGYAVIKGLDNKEYYLEETKAPTGYNMLSERVGVTPGKTVKEQLGSDDCLSVENSTGALLPSTGGIGTTIFYAAGIILMAGAVFFVIRRKRA